MDRQQKQIYEFGPGERDQAFKWLQRAIDERPGWLVAYLKVDPRFDTLRSDPRFAELMRRIKLEPQAG